ncbi:hypothetical protein KJZ88_03400 [Streptomyces sp. Tu102]|nr:hypothetical protein [Streptomyces sp. Tu102]
MYQQVVDGQRQTWELDAQLRLRSWKTETGGGSTWTQTGTKLNHYSGDDDGPRWIVENTATGEISRNVVTLSADLGAVTGKTGDAVLQLTSIHGDVALQLPLNTFQVPHRDVGDGRTGGNTPAGAGSRSSSSTRANSHGEHPRGCGEQAR